MIKIGNTFASKYTFTIDGNDGEEQLIVVSSWGQDGCVAMRILSVRCDGDVDLWPLPNCRHEVHYALQYLHQALAEWAHRGTRPSPSEAKEIAADCGRAIDAYASYYGIKAKA